MLNNPEFKNNYSKNLFSLQQTDKEIFKRLSEIDINQFPEYKVIKSRDPLIYNLLYQKKKSYFDNQNPLKEIHSIVVEGSRRYTQLAVQLGCGLGYLSEICFQKLKKLYDIIIIENNIFLIYVSLHLVDLSEFILQKRIQFVCENDTSLFHYKMTKLINQNGRSQMLKGLRIFSIPFNLERYPDYYKSIHLLIKQSIAHFVSNIGNSPQDSLLGIDHLFQNYDEICSCPGISQIQNLFAGNPAVVVAAGPSLNDQISWLKTIQNQVLILSCDTGWRILLKNGITPHIVTALERDEVCCTLFEDLPEEEFQKVVFAGVPVVTPKTYEYFRNSNKIIVYRKQNLFEWIGVNRGLLETGSSGANLAYSVASALGADPILLLGQDLCFGSQGKTHASNAKYGEIQNNMLSRKKCTVINNNGEEVASNETWMIFLKDYEKQILEYKNTCFSASLHGARINGIPYLSCEDFEKKYLGKDFDFFSLLKESLTAISQAENKEFNEKVFREKTFLTLEYLEKYKNYFQKKRIEYETCILGDPEKIIHFRKQLQFDLEDFHVNSNEGKFIMYILQSNSYRFMLEYYDIESMIFSSELERESVWRDRFYVPLLKLYADLIAISLELILNNIPSHWKEKLERNFEC